MPKEFLSPKGLEYCVPMPGVKGVWGGETNGYPVMDAGKGDNGMLPEVTTVDLGGPGIGSQATVPDWIATGANAKKPMIK